MKAHMKFDFCCQLCHGIFKNRKQLQRHSLEACKLETPPKPGLPTLEQAMELKKRPSRMFTHEDQWFQIHHIVLPGTPQPLSPYYNDVNSTVLSFMAIVRSHGPEIFHDILPFLHVGDQSIPPILADGLHKIFTLWVERFGKRLNTGDPGDPGELAVEPSDASEWSCTTLAPEDAPTPINHFDLSGRETTSGSHIVTT